MRTAASAVTLIAVLTCSVAFPANPDPAAPAAMLISRARAALGPGLGHPTSIHFSGTFTSGDINGTVDSWVDLADGRFATRINAGPLTEGSGYDGHTNWRSDSKDIVLPQTGPLAIAMGANAIFDASYALFKPSYGGASVSYLGARTDAGKNYEAISVTPKGGYAEEEWFDPATALLARSIIDYGALSIITNFSAYRSVDSLMFPCKQVTTRRIDARDFYGNKQGFASSDSTSNYSSAVDIADNDSHFTIPSSALSDVSLPGGETRIPFELQNYWILINVRLNGKGPFRLMLDSGGENILNPSVAWRIGAPETGKVPVSTSSPAVRPTRYVRVASLEVGAATLAEQDFHAGYIGNEFTVYGMIGFELFERFITTIDYANRQIILRLPGGHADPPPSSHGDVSLPLVFDDTKPGTACSVGGTDTTCMIDTGAALALILSGPFVKANPGIQPPWYAGAYGGVFGSSGASEVRHGPLDSFKFGPFALTNVDTRFTTQANGALAHYLSALVGNPVLQHFIVTFDYTHSTLRLTPNSTLDHR